MNKIQFDSSGNIGTVQGENLLPVLTNERMVCSQAEANKCGLKSDQWITLDELRELPNNFADIAYKIFTAQP